MVGNNQEVEGSVQSRFHSVVGRNRAAAREQVGLGRAEFDIPGQRRVRGERGMQVRVASEDTARNRLRVSNTVVIFRSDRRNDATDQGYK